MFTPPTRGEKITWTMFYSLITAQGLAVLIVPPQTIETPLSGPLTSLWGALLVVAIVPTIGAARTRYKWEYTGLLPVIAGMAVYALTLWSLVPATPTRTAQALAITALTVGLGRRWLDRRRLVIQDTTRTQRADPEHTPG